MCQCLLLRMSTFYGKCVFQIVNDANVLLLTCSIIWFLLTSAVLILGVQLDTPPFLLFAIWAVPSWPGDITCSQTLFNSNQEVSASVYNCLSNWQTPTNAGFMSVVHKHSSPPGKQILNIHRLALFDELQYFIVISMVVLVVWCGVWRRPSALYWPASINTSPSPSPWEAPLYHHHHRLNLLLVKWHVHEMTSLACVSKVRGSDCTRWWTISPSAADFFYLFIYFTAVLKPLAPTTSTYDSVDSTRTHYSNQRAF